MNAIMYIDYQDSRDRTYFPLTSPFKHQYLILFYAFLPSFHSKIIRYSGQHTISQILRQQQYFNLIKTHRKNTYMKVYVILLYCSISWFFDLLFFWFFIVSTDFITFLKLKQESRPIIAPMILINDQRYLFWNSKMMKKTTIVLEHIKPIIIIHLIFVLDCLFILNNSDYPQYNINFFYQYNLIFLKIVQQPKSFCFYHS